MKKFQILALASGLALGLTLGAQAQTETTSQDGNQSIATVIAAHTSEDQIGEPTSQQAEGAVVWSCGIHQAIVVWNKPDHGLTALEKVITAIENNEANNFLYCGAAERQEAYDWTDRRVAELMSNGASPENDAFKEMHRLQNHLWANLYINNAIN